MRLRYISIFITGLWITVSEFFRNELLFKHLWIDHYHSIGLEFTTSPINGILWTVWSFLFAWLLSQWLEKFSTNQTFFYSWLSVFVMMWITAYNLQVFPISLLLTAMPLSLLEVWVALALLNQFSRSRK